MPLVWMSDLKQRKQQKIQVARVDPRLLVFAIGAVAVGVDGC